jgi:hypothetical protein
MNQEKMMQIIHDVFDASLPRLAPGDDDETQVFVGMIRKEIDVYRRFSRWYGYVFFLLRARS